MYNYYSYLLKALMFIFLSYQDKKTQIFIWDTNVHQSLLTMALQKKKNTTYILIIIVEDDAPRTLRKLVCSDISFVI